jgi:hypothetical protein
MVLLVVLCQLQQATAQLVQQCVLLLQAVVASATRQAVQLAVGQKLLQLLQHQDRRLQSLGTAGTHRWRW